MLRLVRPLPRSRLLRRVIAALLGVVMSVALAEPLLADSCDGDAPRAVAERVLSHVDGLTPTADTPDTTPGGGAPKHAVHVCHCTHAHGGALFDRIAVDGSTHAVSTTRDARSDRVPPSPALEPQLRPPALPHAA